MDPDSLWQSGYIERFHSRSTVDSNKRIPENFPIIRTQSDHVEVKAGLGRAIVGAKTGGDRIFHNIVADPEGLARATPGNLDW